MLRDKDINEELYPRFLYPTFATTFFDPPRRLRLLRPRQSSLNLRIHLCNWRKQTWSSNHSPAARVYGISRTAVNEPFNKIQDTSQHQYLVFTPVSQALSDRPRDDQTPTSKFSRFLFNLETGL